VASGSKISGSLIVSGGITIPTGSGFFSGSGKGITEIPRSSITDLDQSKIFSGSATASISPDKGFVVNTFSTFQFPLSASMFSGSGRGLTDIPFSALSEELKRIATGSVTASVSPQFGFKVESAQVGSQFTGSVKISGTLTASMYSGSGRGLFDIPLSAFTGDAFRIASGSITASVSPNEGFKVQSLSSGSQLTGS
jgi:hypothetical protein